MHVCNRHSRAFISHSTTHPSTQSPEDKGALPRVASSWTLNGFVVYERPHARDFLRSVRPLCRGATRYPGIIYTYLHANPWIGCDA